jgi:hypothetical protein
VDIRRRPRSLFQGIHGRVVQDFDVNFAGAARRPERQLDEAGDVDGRPLALRHSALAARASPDADQRSVCEASRQQCSPRAQPPWISIGLRLARAVTSSASTAGASRPSKPRACIGSDAASTTRRSSPSSRRSPHDRTGAFASRGATTGRGPPLPGHLATTRECSTTRASRAHTHDRSTAATAHGLRDRGGGLPRWR